MRICILGHFGGSQEFNDGQTVKTKTIYNALINCGFDIDKVDTYYVKNRPLKFCISLIKSMRRDKKYIVLLSSNGRKILFPVLYFLSKHGKEIYHYAIGGRLSREVKKKNRWSKYISSFTGNWMESTLLVKQLNELGINNAKYIPNFKKLNILKIENLSNEYQMPFRFCMFSRVMKEKGVEDAITSINEVNNRYGSVVAKLDIYGPIEEGYDNRLKECLEKAKNSCRYRGIVKATESVEALKDYFMLIFPTHWKHEGIPGTIIDALSAGVPIIARRWQYCDEMLDDKKTGYIYDFEHPEELTEKIWYAVNNPTQVMGMKSNCLARADDYSEEKVMKMILDSMELDTNL